RSRVSRRCRWCAARSPGCVWKACSKRAERGMRVLVQRVRAARVEVEGQVTGAIGPGLLLLVGFEAADAPADPADQDWMVGKLLRLRLFDDEAGVMNRSVLETGGELLAVSQFTLFASTRKGNRPSWS